MVVAAALAISVRDSPDRSSLYCEAGLTCVRRQCPQPCQSALGLRVVAIFVVRETCPSFAPDELLLRIEPSKIIATAYV